MSTSYTAILLSDIASSGEGLELLKLHNIRVDNGEHNDRWPTLSEIRSLLKSVPDSDYTEYFQENRLEIVLESLNGEFSHLFIDDLLNKSPHDAVDFSFYRSDMNLMRQILIIFATYCGYFIVFDGNILIDVIQEVSDAA